MSNVNVLYLGMAYDIMAPLLLVPDLDTLYVLNSLDDAYGTWEEQKDLIRGVLTQGNNAKIANNFYFDESEHNRHKEEEPDKEWKNVHSLEGPSEIISDEDFPSKECLTGSEEYDQYCFTKSVWKLDFLYNGKMRHLIYYYNFNFDHYTWPEDIQNISHFIWNGAYSWNIFTEDDPKGIVRTMTMERSAPNAYEYALSFNHTKFPEHIWVYDGHERYGQSVGKMKLNFTNSNWWKKNYQGGGRRKTRNGRKHTHRNRRMKKRKHTTRRRVSLKTTHFRGAALKM